MRISDTEPSSVIRSQTKFLDKKIEKRCQKGCQKQAKPKRDGVMYPQNYNFSQF